MFREFLYPQVVSIDVIEASEVDETPEWVSTVIDWSISFFLFSSTRLYVLQGPSELMPEVQSLSPLTDLFILGVADFDSLFLLVFLYQLHVLMFWSVPYVLCSFVYALDDNFLWVIGQYSLKYLFWNFPAEGLDNLHGQTKPSIFRHIISMYTWKIFGLVES